MKHGGQILLGLCFALLMLLGARTLVEGPDREMTAPPFAWPVHACLTAAESADVQAAMQLAQPDAAGRRFAMQETARPQLPATRLVRESNGWPLTSRSYVRTVYTAFPLEDMPG